MSKRSSWERRMPDRVSGGLLWDAVDRATSTRPAGRGLLAAFVSAASGRFCSGTSWAARESETCRAQAGPHFVHPANAAHSKRAR